MRVCYKNVKLPFYSPNSAHKHGYSVVGIVVGVLLATAVLVIITGIVYLGVTYQCRKKQMHSKLFVGSEQGSTISVSLSKDPELVLSE